MANREDPTRETHSRYRGNLVRRIHVFSHSTGGQYDVQ